MAIGFDCACWDDLFAHSDSDSVPSVASIRGGTGTVENGCGGRLARHVRQATAKTAGMLGRGFLVAAYGASGLGSVSAYQSGWIPSP